MNTIWVTDHSIDARAPPKDPKLRQGWNSIRADRAAENIGANLIVMSSHSYSWLDRILHGSDAEGVLRRAPCPALIAKEPNQTRISPILN